MVLKIPCKEVGDLLSDAKSHKGACCSSLPQTHHFLFFEFLSVSSVFIQNKQLVVPKYIGIKQNLLISLCHCTKPLNGLVLGLQYK